MSDKKVIRELDLRGYAGPNETTRTVVQIRQDFAWVPWIRCGASRLNPKNKDQEVWFLEVLYGDGTTDFEHDSARVLSIPLIGLRFSGLWEGGALFEAYIDPSDIRSFWVPDPDAPDPRQLPEARVCGDCHTPHPIVPEGHYVPPLTDAVRELYELVRGERVQISIRFGEGDDEG